MIVSFVRRLRPLMRGYGWEDPKDKWSKNWWQYADSDYTGDKTPEERGYQLDHWEKRLNDEWKTKPRVTQTKRLAEGGTDSRQILDMELKENPLGDYDTNEHFIPKGQIKTRIIHILRHFEKVDLRNLNWDANILDGLKLDEFERVALLTSIEHEFETVIEDNVFDSMKTLNDAVKYISTDRYVL
ncbi:unnamed protein product [Blepharisma stoltei]|uniref:Acyl carrier protein n=1 Tax=Blepharisma stoltei TaxID=1481888 RepID=A0AAU9I9V4_9CILI|nr:unnamed protein product [Blepharisma stoltei]